MSLQSQNRHRSTPNVGSTNQNRSTPSGSHQVHTSIEEVGVILDEWNSGLLKDEEIGNLASKKDMHYLTETLRSVPDKQTSTRIVEYSLKMMGWVHCALRVDHFLLEHEVFHNALASGTIDVLQDSKWMSVYFSILAVSPRPLMSWKLSLPTVVDVFVR